MNIAETTVAKSDQQNYDDYLGGITRTVTITAVTKGNAEQPVNVELAEFPGRPYKPNKSMRRLLVLAWGPDSAAYVGRQLTLYGDPTVKFGGATVGGIKIAAMSHLPGPLTVALTVTRGKRAPFTVQPIGEVVKVKDTSGRDWLAELSTAGEDLDAIAKLGTAANAAHASEQTVQLIRSTFVRVRDTAAAQPPLVTLTDPAPAAVASFVPTKEEGDELSPEEYAAWEAEQLAIAQQNGEVQS